MDEYIKREDAIKSVISMVPDQVTAVNVITALEQVPKADVAEVEQGKWLPIWDDCSLVKCSACGYEYMDKIECKNFCGKCGAKMKGTNND